MFKKASYHVWVLIYGCLSACKAGLGIGALYLLTIAVQKYFEVEQELTKVLDFIQSFDSYMFW